MVKTNLTDQQGLEIYYRIKNGERKVFLSQEYKCSLEALRNIEYCKLRWKCLNQLINK